MILRLVKDLTLADKNLLRLSELRKDQHEEFEKGRIIVGMHAPTPAAHAAVQQLTDKEVEALLEDRLGPKVADELIMNTQFAMATGAEDVLRRLAVIALSAP